MTHPPRPHVAGRWPLRAAGVAAVGLCAAIGRPAAAAPPPHRLPAPVMAAGRNLPAEPDTSARRDVIIVLHAPPALDRIAAHVRARRPAPPATGSSAPPGSPWSASTLSPLAPLPSPASPGARASGVPPTSAGAATVAVAAAAAVAAVAAEQAPLRARIGALGIPILSAYGTVANGFLVAARPSDIARLAALPGVAEVIAAPNHRLALADAVPHIGADRVVAAAGFDGRGVTIGVIDTGIDYLHAAFGGPGSAAAYAGDDHTVVEDGSFPTTKVVGGHDFAGSQYGGSGAPTPDDDPIDENGHGTHVAGIAAAQAWSGRHGGVAPGARLVALKVFGASGSTNLAYDAIEWAVEAKLGLAVPGRAAAVDVLNLSLGSAWASTSSFEQLLIDRAVAAGIVIVGAAGNDGDVAFVTGGPGMAPSAIGVASTVGPGQLGDRVQAIFDGVTVDVEALEAHPSLTARTAALGPLQGRAIWLGRGCDGDALPGGSAGRIALLVRGDCTFRVKLAIAAAAGAAAAIVVDNGGGLVAMGGDGAVIPIPAYMIGAADGRRLQTAIGAGTAVEIRLDAAFNGRFPHASLVDTVSGFSSRGITRDGTFKPDLAAPGTAIRAPAIASGNRAAALSGTSMAAPMIAGSAAVVIQALAAAGHRLQGTAAAHGVTPQDVRTLLTSTAFTDVHRVAVSEPGVAPFALRGAGRVALEGAVRTRTLLRPSSGGSALSFGALAAAEPWSGSLPFELRNLTDTPRRYALSVVASGPGEATPGVRFVPADGVLTIGPSATGASQLRSEIRPGDLERYVLRGGTSAMNGDHRLADAERDAYLVATEIGADDRPTAGGDVVRLPVWALARGASDLAAADVVVLPPGAPGASIELSNRGAQPGRSEAFTLLATDAVESSPTRALNAVHLGARVTGSGAARRVELAVVFAGPSLAPFDVAVEASIDIDRDGEVDRVLTIDDAAAAQDGPWSGTLVTIAAGGRGRSATVVGPADVDVNSRLVVLAADTATLGFAADAAVAFNVAVETTARFGGARVDSIPDGAVRSGRFVVPLWFAADAGPLFVDEPSHVTPPGQVSTIPVRAADGADLGAARLLMLYPDDEPGAAPDGGDAQVITLRIASPPTPPAGPTPTAALSPLPAASPPAGATSTASGPTPTAPTPSAPSPTPTATRTAAATPSPSDEPTRAPHRPTVVLPVEPTAAVATPPIEPTPTIPASTATAIPLARRVFLPFAYRYVRRPRP